jgi:hypothetical protein
LEPFSDSHFPNLLPAASSYLRNLTYHTTCSQQRFWNFLGFQLHLPFNSASLPACLRACLPVWSGLVWPPGLVWSGLVWSGLVCPGLVCSGLASPGLVFGLALFLASGLVWSGLWFVLVWSGLVWSGLVWSGLVWSGVAWLGEA